VEEKTPTFLENSGRGWVTAEYSMLPGSVPNRKPRERNRSDSRSIEIGRLIGRSLRSVVALERLAGYTVTVDADVIQADGGTRTAAITGGWVALKLCFRRLMAEGKISEDPLTSTLAAVSAGVVDGQVLLDLCYQEDSRAEADMNYVGTVDGTISEIQISGEKRPVEPAEFAALLGVCRQGVEQLVRIQKECVFGKTVDCNE